MALYRFKKKKCWIIKALDKSSKRLIAWVLGKRSAKNFSKLYAKLRHLTDCTFYSDHWRGFTAVLPTERHIIGKKYTFIIEQDNSNTRHYLARFKRRSKVISRSISMLHLSLNLYVAFSYNKTPIR